MRSTDRNRFQKDAEARFPIKVDIPVPEGGVGRRLTDMLDWCRESIAAGAWAQHGGSERRKGEAPRDYTRWYFMNDADAEAFDRRWLDGAAAAEIDLQRDLEPIARTYSDARGAGATDLAARLAADAVLALRHRVLPNDETARRGGARPG